MLQQTCRPADLRDSCGTQLHTEVPCNTQPLTAATVNAGCFESAALLHQPAVHVVASEQYSKHTCCDSAANIARSAVHQQMAGLLRSAIPSMGGLQDQRQLQTADIGCDRDACASAQTASWLRAASRQGHVHGTSHERSTACLAIRQLTQAYQLSDGCPEPTRWVLQPARDMPARLQLVPHLAPGVRNRAANRLRVHQCVRAVRMSTTEEPQSAVSNVLRILWPQHSAPRLSSFRGLPPHSHALADSAWRAGHSGCSHEVMSMAQVLGGAKRDVEQGSDGLWADSVKRKRRAKMKKHKWKKRRKLLRRKSKVSQGGSK
jgi:Mitochondrial domain of unknown function (DUF1713)